MPRGVSEERRKDIEAALQGQQVDIKFWADVHSHTHLLDRLQDGRWQLRPGVIINTFGTATLQTRRFLERLVEAQSDTKAEWSAFLAALQAAKGPNHPKFQGKHVDKACATIQGAQAGRLARGSRSTRAPKPRYRRDDNNNDGNDDDDDDDDDNDNDDSEISSTLSPRHRAGTRNQVLTHKRTPSSPDREAEAKRPRTTSSNDTRTLYLTSSTPPASTIPPSNPTRSTSPPTNPPGPVKTVAGDGSVIEGSTTSLTIPVQPPIVIISDPVRNPGELSSTSSTSSSTSATAPSKTATGDRGSIEARNLLTTQRSPPRIIASSSVCDFGHPSVTKAKDNLESSKWLTSETVDYLLGRLLPQTITRLYHPSSPPTSESLESWRLTPPKPLLSTTETVLVPFCLESHWVLFCYVLRSKKVVVLDSYTSKLRRSWRPFAVKIGAAISAAQGVEDSHPVWSWPSSNDTRMPPQQVGTQDCGVFTIVFALLMAANMDVYSARVDAQLWRRLLVLSLSTESLNDEVANWVMKYKLHEPLKVREAADGVEGLKQNFRLVCSSFVRLQTFFTDLNFIDSLLGGLVTKAAGSEKAAKNEVRKLTALAEKAREATTNVMAHLSPASGPGDSEANELAQELARVTTRLLEKHHIHPLRQVETIAEGMDGNRCHLDYLLEVINKLRGQAEQERKNHIWRKDLAIRALRELAKEKSAQGEALRAEAQGKLLKAEAMAKALEAEAKALMDFVLP